MLKAYKGRHLLANYCYNSDKAAMLLYSLFCIFMTIIPTASASYRNYTGYRVLSLTPKSQYQLDLIQQLRRNEGRWQLDFWKETNIIGDHADVMVPPNIFDAFEKFLGNVGIQYNVAVQDVQRLINLSENDDSLQLLRTRRRRRLKRAISRFRIDKYHSFDKIDAYLRSLAKKHKFVSVIDIGTSYEKRPMRLLKISTPGRSKKPGFWIDGGFHAREWIAPATALYIINKLITGYKKKDLKVKRLLGLVDFYILPVANPDGYEYSRRVDRMWRKTRSINRCQRRFRRQCCRGADMNRNFPYMFGGAGSSSDRCESDYRGRKPWSEAETKNIGKWLLNNKRIVDAYVTLHSYGLYWFYPYGYATSAKPPDVRELRKVALDGATALKRVHGTRYLVGNGAALLYPADGTSDDWVKSIGIKYSYCIELRPKDSMYSYGFILPTNQIIPTGEETWEGIRVIAKQVARRRRRHIIKT